MLKAFISALGRRARYHQASRANADAQLRSHETACVVAEGAIARIDVAHLPANRPTEDHYAVAKCLASGAFLFGTLTFLFGTLYLDLKGSLFANFIMWLFPKKFLLESIC